MTDFLFLSDLLDHPLDLQLAARDPDYAHATSHWHRIGYLVEDNGADLELVEFSAGCATLNAHCDHWIYDGAHISKLAKDQWVTDTIPDSFNQHRLIEFSRIPIFTSLSTLSIKTFNDSQGIKSAKLDAILHPE